MLATDVAYMVRVAQMPVLAICFIFCMDDDSKMRQAERGMLAAAAIELAILLISVLTGTANSTYAENTGLSGWVIDSNRCAMSIIFAVLAHVLRLLCAEGQEACHNAGRAAGRVRGAARKRHQGSYLTFIIICVCGIIMLVIRFICGRQGRAKARRDCCGGAGAALRAEHLFL